MRTYDEAQRENKEEEAAESVESKHVVEGETRRSNILRLVPYDAQLVNTAKWYSG